MWLAYLLQGSSRPTLLCSFLHSVHCGVVRRHDHGRNGLPFAPALIFPAPHVPIAGAVIVAPLQNALVGDVIGALNNRSSANREQSPPYLDAHFFSPSS